jgi:hypothetical protein
VTLIDHHKTALEDLAGLPSLHTFTDLERSGATLAWDYLFPDKPRPLLLGHIEDRYAAGDGNAELLQDRLCLILMNVHRASLWSAGAGSGRNLSIACRDVGTATHRGPRLAKIRRRPD